MPIAFVEVAVAWLLQEELCGMATEKWFMDGGVLHVENLVKVCQARGFRMLGF